MHGNRKFYDIPLQKESTEENSSAEVEYTGSGLKRYINKSVIGNDKVFSGPYGLRNVVYCDYTASGRSLAFIEDYIRENVLSDYGNTHTTTSVSSLQTTLFRHEARDIIRNSVKAGEHDVVLFTGSGCTGAVHKLVNALKLSQPPIVFVGPYEHHSALLPWRELGAMVIRIREDCNGLVDKNHLLSQLQRYQGDSRQLIGCFSAASNITGILVNTDEITGCLHQYGALAFWDYATAGPYVNIDMNPVSQSGDPSLTQKDAIFISPHKFVGGVQTPGVLIAKKKLFVNHAPDVCGGGTVFFVRREGHRYLQEIEMREEGGTPAIVESVRAGLVFQLKEAVSPEVIMAADDRWCSKAVSSWKQCKQLVLLGSMSVPRLPIFSFLMRHTASGRFLHYNFVCALLNDLFGIQARGGCACAGPYAQELLGIGEELSADYEQVLLEDSRLDRTHLRRYREYSDREVLRPGFVRLNLAYFMDEETVDYVIEAVKMVAEYGWSLLPQYRMNPETGEWRHSNHQVFHDRKWLGHVTYKTGQMTVKKPSFHSKGPLPSSLEECLEMAKAILTKPRKESVHLGDQRSLFTGRADELRWFLLPSEAHGYLTNSLTTSTRPIQLPFTPLSYPRNVVPDPTDDGDYSPASNGLNISLNSPKTNTAVDESTDNVGNGSDSSSKTADTGKRQESFQHGMKYHLDRGYGAEQIISEGSQTADSAGFHHGSVYESQRPVTQQNGDLHENKDSQNTCHGELGTHVINKTVSQRSISPSNHPSNSQSQQDSAKHASKNNSSDLVDDSMKAVCHQSSPLENIIDPRNVAPSESKEKFCTDGSCFIKRRKNKSEMPASGKAKERPVNQKWYAPPKAIFKPTVKALEEFDMIRDGDRVLVCLSGGKDSLSLLHTLHQYQYYSRKKGVSFTLGAVTVDPMTSSYDPSPLKPYLASLGVPYFYEEQCILDSAADLPYEVASICSYCSRMKRGRLYAAARREGYNVLAMGQHLDDLAESFLMSVFHNGLLRTMKASYTVREGDLRLVRPFVYVREKDLRQFAESNKLPIIAENCPACFEAPKERHRMKQLLASQEILHPRLFPSLQSALHPILAISRTGMSASRLLHSALGDLTAIQGQQVDNDDDDDDDL